MYLIYKERKTMIKSKMRIVSKELSSESGHLAHLIPPNLAKFKLHV